MKKRYLATLKQAQAYLDNREVFEDRYDLTITTMKRKSKNNFIVDYTDRKNPILYISKEVTDLSYLFNFNTQVKSIVFDNFDASNIKSLDTTFASLKLEKTLDLSGLNLDNLKSLSFAFSAVTVDGNIVLPKSLPSLEILDHVFFDTTAKKVTLNFNAPKVKDTSKMLEGAEIEEIIK